MMNNEHFDQIADLLDDEDSTLLDTQDLLGKIQAGTKSLVLKAKGKTFPLTLAPVYMGRDADCTILFDSKTVSRFHAIIYRFGKQFIIRDLHSTNGMTVNGKRKMQSPIRPGDKICLGDQAIEVLGSPKLAESYTTQCAVVFLDIQDYKALCEHYGDFFSKYAKSILEHLEDKILLNQGCPIKNMGDGLMCAFGLWPTVGAVGDRALSFANFATGYIQKKYKELPPLNLRVGMAFGNVDILGEKELDLLGDTVNLAARLKLANRLYGTHILMDEKLVTRLHKKKNSIRELDTVRVQGKNQPVTIYTFDDHLLTHPMPDSDIHTQKLKPKHRSGDYALNYQKGLEFYRQGDFSSALPYFSKAASAGDSPAEFLLERVQKIVTSNRELSLDNWQGIWNIEK